jgi:Transposase DDE domain/Domain of unknown function (DUF4372)
VPDQHTVLYQLLKHVPEARFEERVKTHGSDDAARGLDSKSQLVALLYGQLSGAEGLRAIVSELESHAERLSELGCDPVKRSTLSEANRHRPAALFGDLLAAVMAQAHRGLRRHVKETTYLIDSTSVSLSALSGRWAHFSAKACGAKAHIVYDPDADRPVYAAVTPARVTDLTAAKAMPIEAGATYVFDLGYYDYGWWAELHEAGCRIVTRFKTNTPLTVEEERPVPPPTPDGGVILSDRAGRLPERQASRRKNPFQATVREVKVRIETGKVLRILSNDLKASAQEIADLYKRRWAIELFFRWVKQTLKIRHFVGTSENAVRLQIAVALTAFVLLRLAQATQDAIKSPLAFARLVRANLMHRRRIDQLLRPEAQPKKRRASGLQEAPA